MLERYMLRHTKNENKTDTLYSLKLRKCDRCKNSSVNTYYCESCRKDFCCFCIHEEAHEEAHQPVINQEVMDCHWIHQAIDNSDINEDVEYPDDIYTYIEEAEVEKHSVSDIHNCECGNPSTIETFKVNECRKYSCKVCPRRSFIILYYACLMT